MNGNVEQFKTAILDKLEEANLNELELGLLKKAMDNP